NVCGSLMETTPTPLAKYKYIKILNEDREEITYACKPDSQGALSLRRENSAGSSILIDESQLRIKGEECYFTCSQNFLTDPPTVGISFTLEDNNGSASIQFKTSVTMRNVNK
ncbi:MAG: hypothetical protein HYV38_03175, partial [Candidatus Levybacteria bacterium]|nr:hypothetical protein [Candidatus Levybacteria bacterium]